MRILHTGDWHVGRTVRGLSRADEHVAVLSEIAGIAAEEKVDLVLVAGDVFDTAAPTAEAERIVYRALLDLAVYGTQVVVVAGNHDHPQRLSAVAPLFDVSRVHVAGGLQRPGEGGVIDVPVRSGETARIALLPFLSQRGIVRAADLMALGAGEHAQDYDARARSLITALCDGFGGKTVNVLVGHLMVVGGELGGGERAAHTIFDYSVSSQAFPATANYVALGHLHRPQKIAAACPAWYSGSPLQLDFGEGADQKAVLVVDAAPGQPAEVRTVALRSGRKLRTIRATLADLQALAGTTGDDYLRVVVAGEASAGLAEQVREWFPFAVDVSIERPDDPRRAGQDRAPARLGRPPRELFAEYLSERAASDQRVLALFDELWEEVHAPDAA